jgi:hypothetical protein
MQSTTAPGIIPASTINSEIGDALDFLEDSRRFMDLVAMACRNSPDDDQKAMAAGIHAALDKLEKASSVLEGVWHPALKAAA